MHEIKENRTPEEELPEEQEVYTPRPVWQRVMAGVLAGRVILGVIGYYYWIARRY